MGIDAYVRCRCFEEGRLKPGPVPYEDLYIDEEGFLSSRRIDDARGRFDYRQFQARYGELERAFMDWARHACDHEDGKLARCRMGNMSGAIFHEYCDREGKGRLEILSNMLFDSGGMFPVDLAPLALKELDELQAWIAKEAGDDCCVTSLFALRKLLRASIESGNPIIWC